MISGIFFFNKGVLPSAGAFLYLRHNVVLESLSRMTWRGTIRIWLCVAAASLPVRFIDVITMKTHPKQAMKPLICPELSISF